MKGLKRFLVAMIILLPANIILFTSYFNMSRFAAVVLFVLDILFYVLYSIIPGRISGKVHAESSVRMQALYGGSELIITAAIGFTVEVVIYLLMLDQISVATGLYNALLCITMLFLLAVQGVFRLLLLSRQIGMTTRVLLLFAWWIPFVNVYLIVKASRVARLEYEVELHREELYHIRKENQICQTKYPVLMVHGVFFRDWHYFNYWGRVPKELVRNGANVYYGRQQSALSVKASAEELKEQILEILQEAGSEKVNMIAHSKGGLDARYAISCLGMAPYVASLTTINTPHYGCEWVDRILQKIPDKIVKMTARKYNKLFRRLGDKEPDFYSAVYNLTAAFARQFNEEVKDQAGVLYQSVMSRMDSPRNARFPLNITYRIMRRSKCANDGLVPVESARWGTYLGLLHTPGKRGISHGDMIDLNRENIRDFDVRDFYSDLIHGLHQRGF